jgi:hypothetical protein
LHGTPLDQATVEQLVDELLRRKSFEGLVVQIVEHFDDKPEGKVRVDVKQSHSLPRARAEKLLKSAIAAVHQLEAQRTRVDR